ncbi:PREDICTED: angiogenic factor with G patch and FHA domains 1 isoform X2 [Wasmannia auropunctata]|uniref:angiogenic factor with G patch and FHA domains 1 isoform X2 n=1 Tax=Wasmannia auropunctata TaxID=64793 RepID=UPI0005EFCA47|nr:PREDICTED: angiogenic factor with G patch and FHA domains 1 isoform X2 [Wasmannia auropunctata]
MHSESEEGEIVFDFEDFTEELHSFPHIIKFIRKLHDHIKKQQKKIDKLRRKLNEQKQQDLLCTKTYVHCGTQTNPLDFNKLSLSQNWDVSDSVKSPSIVDQVTQVAESALLQTGFVYEQTSGMYYDYNTGYYYDTKQGLYYDGNTGTYYYYDEASKTYQFHSQICTNKTTPTHLATSQMKEEQGIGKSYKVLNEIDKLIEDISDITIERYRQQALDLAKNYPPCMRIIVKETDLTKLKLGSLFLVTCTGGSLGREGDHSVLIPDINISKYHARFIYDEAKKQYQVIDSGSRNGTFINGKRLSVAKQESEPHEITHGSVIKIGGTKLLCHIHNGNETCGHCEPGLVQQNINLNENKALKTKLHKEELRRLKHKFGIENDNVISSSQLASGYQDRAQARRQHVGSSDPHAKTQQSSIYTSITKDNKGFKLLSKMGWSEGRSLGKDGDGRTEPLPIACNHNKVGLGSKKADVSNIELDSSMEKKQAVWRKTQKRYKEIVD